MNGETNEYRAASLRNMKRGGGTTVSRKAWYVWHCRGFRR